MTKKTPGAKRGAKPQNDDKNLDLLADELTTGKFTKFEFETEITLGGKVSYNLTGASRAVAKAIGADEHHDGATRKRLTRKMQREIAETPEIMIEDDERSRTVERLEKTYVRDAQARGLFLPDRIAKALSMKDKT